MSTQGQGVATRNNKDDVWIAHEKLLRNALYCPESPTNVISITKLDKDNHNRQLNIQTFDG